MPYIPPTYQVPAGYELTGETRCPRVDELYMGCSGLTIAPMDLPTVHPIVRKKEEI